LDFTLVLRNLLERLDRDGIRYALMGGFALGMRGSPRATNDLDFLVERDDLAKLDTVMQGLGYELRYRSDNVSQFVSPLGVMGVVDFLHAFREASREALQQAERLMWADDAPAMPVLRIEDLVGFKLQASCNDPERAARDNEDIERLIAATPEQLDWRRIEEYFALFGRAAEFVRLRERYRR
jgi:hypothetical protein